MLTLKTRNTNALVFLNPIPNETLLTATLKTETQSARRPQLLSQCIPKNKSSYSAIQNP